MKKLRAIAYCRVSTVTQEEGRSLEFQIKKCQDYCEFNNYELIEIIQDVESGGNDERKGFLELTSKIKARLFDVLVVFESSRISRITLTMLNFVLELQKSNIHFISISQPELNTTTPTGMLFFQIQSSLSEYERKQISVRVKSNKWARAREGIWQGGKLPLGYKKDPQNNDIILIDEDNAIIVKSIFDYYLRTQSIAKTSKYFNKPMESIRWILTNPFYKGLFRYGKKENNINTGIVKINKDYQYFEGNHSPIISDEIFDKVQSIISLRKKNISVSFKLLFTGLVTCSCGGKYFSAKNGHKYNYRCSDCGKAISYRKMEGNIIKEILKLSELEELNEVDLKIENYSLQIDSISQLIEKDKKAREKVMQLFKNDLISIDELKKEVNDIDDSILYKEKEIKRIKNFIDNQKTNSEKVNNLKLLKEAIEYMEDEDREDIHDLFKLMIKEIVILNKDEINVKTENINLKIFLK